MRTRSARFATAVLLLGSALGLAACQTPPVPELTPRSIEQLEPFVGECGKAVPAATGDTSFTAELSMTDASGMRLAIAVEAAGGEHGEHELGRTSLRVVDGAGRVVGIVMADAWRDLSGLRGTLAAELGSCPGESGDVGAPLDDGAYSIVASGGIRPIDHVHAQEEVWLAEPLAVDVVGGAIVAD
ncbi:hypothetical protein [Agrococcus sp. ARC_14]|uniref:hypothetical protein n=1 Tax=Agrococcus sp. ARC_14 TaxID=2919927 RepID=UPI001F05EDBD|nr:hypothetical protein [Agrococcus sp. ARC_14]MCH1882361.1 hypothetical protein [Agrococcus sp. ARC_14]